MFKDSKRFGLERRVRSRDGVPVEHWHVILFYRNLCFGRFTPRKYVDPIELFYEGLCKRCV